MYHSQVIPEKALSFSFTGISCNQSHHANELLMHYNILQILGVYFSNGIRGGMGHIAV